MLTIRTFTAIWQALYLDQNKLIKNLLTPSEIINAESSLIINWKELLTLIEPGPNAIEAKFSDGPYKGCTILWFAALANEWELVEELLKRGASSLDSYPTEKYHAWHTIILYAAVHQKTAIIKLLLEKGVSIQLLDNFSLTPDQLEDIARSNDGMDTNSSIIIKVANRLFELCAVTPTNIIEINHLKKELASILKILGPALNGKKDGETALSTAIKNNNIIVIDALLISQENTSKLYLDSSPILLFSYIASFKPSINTTTFIAECDNIKEEEPPKKRYKL